FSDPGVNDGPWTVTVTWGDTASTTFTTTTQGALSQAHTYINGGTYTVAVTVTDKDGGSSTAQPNVTLSSPPAGTTAIIDDSASGFSTIGAWAASSTEGFQGGMHYAQAGNGSSVAPWPFTAVAPGPYYLSATWTNGLYRADNAVFTISSGGQVLGTAS